MEFHDVFWSVVVFLLLFGGSSAAFVKHLQSRRHEFKLAMAKEKARFEQARAKTIEEQNRQTALEVRRAELEIERYDRRIPGLPPIPHLDGGADTGEGQLP